MSEPKQHRTLQPDTDDIHVVIELFWNNLCEECPECIPTDPEMQTIVKEFCFSAMITGIDWSLTQSPKFLAELLQKLRAEDSE